MSIASKKIAGCSPIAGGACGVTIILEVGFFGQTSMVFTPILLDPLAADGDCITAYAYHDTAIAGPDYADTIAPGHCDETTAYPHNDDVSTRPWQKCKEAA
jgi:hypothetical protein